MSDLVNLGNAGNAVLGIFAVLGGIGGAVGYFGKSRGDQIIKYQAIEITNRDSTIARLEKDNSALTRENELLHQQNNKLWDKAQGNPQLKRLTQAITTLTDTVNGNIKKGKS